MSDYYLKDFYDKLFYVGNDLRNIRDDMLQFEDLKFCYEKLINAAVDITVVRNHLNIMMKGK